MIPKRGMRFLHSRWINEDRTPAECEVTRVTKYAVYYKFAGQKKASYYVDRNVFADSVKEVITQP